jgi:hypothetical protein
VGVVSKTKRKRKPTTARDPVSHPRRWLQWAGSLLLVTAGCTETTTQVPTSAPPVPAGQARVWFYRDWESSESLNLALVDMNGSYAGAVANGSVFYRDVPPGHYHIAPQSYGRDINQDKDVDVAPGQQLYCKIVSSRSWELGVGGSQSGFDRDTFYVWLMAPRWRRPPLPATAPASNRIGL